MTALRIERLRRASSAKTSNSVASMVVAGTLMSAIIVSALVFHATTPLDKELYPIQMDIVSVKTEAGQFVEMRPYLTLAKTANAGNVCRTLPRLHDAIVRVLFSFASKDQFIDTGVVRAIIDKGIQKYEKDSRVVESVDVTGPFGGTWVRPPTAVILCGQGGDFKVVRQ